jgi:hypothetical protein
MEVHLAQPSGPSDQNPTRQGVVGVSPRTAPQTTPSASTATGAASDLGQQTREAVDEVKHEARDAARHAKQQARSAATKQKDAAAERVGGFAHALNTASDDLRERGQEFAAQYVHKAADGLERASDVLRERDVDQLLGTVEDFARRQPVAFLGAAVAAGFGLARLMKSSAERRHGASHGTQPRVGGNA